jgi:hypothetical protein
MLLYNDFNKLERGFNNYNSDFKNEFNLKEKELNLIKNILLFKDNNINSEFNNGFFY